MEDAHRPIPEGCSLSAPLGDVVSELAALWRDSRSPEVAGALVRLSDAYASFFRPLPKKGPAIDRVIDGGDDRYLTLLLRAVTRGPEAAAAERLERIGKRFGGDPRLRSYVDRWRQRRPYGLLFESSLDVVHHEMTDAVTPRPLTEAELGTLARADELLASMPKRRAALSLLRDVYARPEDIALRLVLADALSELGDPWGELIAIQCSRTPGTAAREAELLHDHGWAWLGRLGRWVLANPEPSFEAGFPSVA